MAKRISYWLRWVLGVVILLLVVGGVMFLKPGPGPEPKPVILQKALLIEIDPGFHARQVIDKGNTINFISDEAEHAFVHVSFKRESPCASGPQQDGSQGICVVSNDAIEPFIFEYCKDLKSFPNSCGAGTTTGEIRVRKKPGSGEQGNDSVSAVFISLMNNGQINHLVIPGELVKWAEREHHDMPRKIVFPASGPSPTNPCGLGPGTVNGECTIRQSIEKDYDYECEVPGCKDPTLHVRSQNPNPPSPSGGSQPSPTN